jgi:hypothetical protein
MSKARYTQYKLCIQVSIQENLDQENLNSSLCIHDARNFDEYTQVLAGDTTNKMAFSEERRVLPFVLHYYVQLYCEGD